MASVLAFLLSERVQFSLVKIMLTGRIPYLANEYNTGRAAAVVWCRRAFHTGSCGDISMREDNPRAVDVRNGLENLSANENLISLDVSAPSAAYIS